MVRDPNRFALLSLLIACGSDGDPDAADGPASGPEPTPDTGQPEPDADGDGVVASEDCDDDDPASTVVAEDADCDGVVTEEDCDDEDPASTAVAADADCDGVATEADCDDEDPASTVVAADADCDGVVTEEDCDDDDPASTVVAEDADCDGAVTGDDCDDGDDSVYPGAPELMGDGVDNNCNGIIDGALDDSVTSCCATPETNRVYGSASEHAVPLGDIDGDGTNDFAMQTEGSSSWYTSDMRYRTDVFLGSDLPTSGPAVLVPAISDEDADDWRWRWPGSAVGDLDGDGLHEMFLNGNDGGMLVRGDTWATLLDSGTLPNTGPGRYAGNGPNVQFFGATTAEGPAVLLAARHDGGDSKFQSLKTRSAALLDESGWGSGGSLAWAGYDAWVYFSWSVTQPTHVLVADFDGDGLSDVLAHHGDFSASYSSGNSLRVYAGASRPASSSIDYEEADFVLTAPTDSVRWIARRAGYGKVGLAAADFNSDGHTDLVTVDWEAGSAREGRVYLNDGARIATEGTVDVGSAGTIIDPGEVGAHAILQASLAGDNDHDGSPDLWVVGMDHEGDPNTQHARFFSGVGLDNAGTVDLADADATWRPPASEYTGTAETVWVSAPGDLDGDGYEDALLGATDQIWLLTTVAY